MVTVVTGEISGVAEDEPQPVVNAKAMKIEAKTPQYALPVIVFLPFLRIMSALRVPSLKFW